MLFSLIIPTYNRASFILSTVESVLKQDFSDFEVIIVDDGSTDNTEEILKKITDPRVKYFKIPNSERGYARNFGTRHSSGEYVTFLDSDDILLPDHFSHAAEDLKKFDRPPFFHLGYEIVNNNNKVQFKVDSLRSDDITCLVKGNPLSCTGCFLRKDVSREFVFNEDRELAGSEDWELWFRVLANHGIKTDTRVSARMYNHDARSVAKAEEKKLVLRKELALKYAFRDKNVAQKYGPYYKKIDAFGDGYIALHLALAGQKKRTVYYTRKFIKAYPFALFSKRFLVILKYLLFN